MRIQDCLTNCDRDCVKRFASSTLAQCDSGAIYGRGIINGLVSGLMSTGKTFDEAIAYVKSRCTDAGPHGPFDEQCIPPAWRDAWKAARVHQP